MDCNSAPLLQVNKISKAFGTTRALINVSFSVHQGEIVAVVGENGAGKSTLARILAGSITPDSGEILLDGVPVVLHSPRDGLLHGISFIPQELAYLSNMTVAENVLVGRWPASMGLTSNRRIQEKAQIHMERCGIMLDVSRPMSDLKLAECQLVEIVKALTQSARLVILDEPTSSLSEPESENLFNVVQRLTKEGIGIIYISHRIDEVFRYGHRVEVLRSGELVASRFISETKPNQVIMDMLGRNPINLQNSRDTSKYSNTLVLNLINWSSGGRPHLHNVNISVHRGEIVGLFGLRGCGSDIVVEGLVGLRSDIKGEFIFNGQKRDLFSNPRIAHDAQLIYLPPERKRDGLILPLSVHANMSLSILHKLSWIGIIKHNAEISLVERLIQQLNIHCRNIYQSVSDLSGGNQQKVLLARCIAAEPKALVLHEPTRGVDVGARFEIHKILRDISNLGTAILWVTSDVEEAILSSDRLLIMREGAIVAELKGQSKTQQKAVEIAEMEVA
jgi:ABC-type sugar transport system ATPase subunit